MYDRPELRGAHDRLWALLDLGLPRTDPDDLWAHWHDPDLLFSQTCGLPYRMGLDKHLTLLGAPDFKLPGCPPGYYNSVIVTRTDDPRSDMAAFAKAPVAFNQPHSQSGWGALFAYGAAHGVTFANLVETGGHAASARALLDETVDLACIDAHTYWLLCREMPLATDLRILDRTPPTPATPYVTAQADRAPQLRAKLEAAVSALPTDDKAHLGLHGIAHVSHDAFMALPLPPQP